MLDLVKAVQELYDSLDSERQETLNHESGLAPTARDTHNRVRPLVLGGLENVSAPTLAMEKEAMIRSLLVQGLLAGLQDSSLQILRKFNPSHAQTVESRRTAA